jgi:hypothetical protein
MAIHCLKLNSHRLDIYWNLSSIYCVLVAKLSPSSRLLPLPLPTVALPHIKEYILERYQVCPFVFASSSWLNSQETAICTDKSCSTLKCCCLLPELSHLFKFLRSMVLVHFEILRKVLKHLVLSSVTSSAKAMY